MTATSEEPSAPRITQRDLEVSSPASQGLIAEFAAVGVMLSGLLTGTAAVSPAASPPALPRTMRNFPSWSGNGLSFDDLQGLASRPIMLIAQAAAVGTRASAQATPAAQVRYLWDASGLTGDQMARLFGVSRRAVHLWASGGRMNAAHHEQLARIIAIIDALPGDTPARRRAALLAPRDDGMSLFDLLRAEHASRGDTDISGTPWRPADLLSSMQEPEDT